ncbi:MAG TPA: hypothetical protein VKA44_01285 [Gemmatimonadota bacterium]|nr:hypothetical protein [Gemmatimonadota bacterium]
MRRPGWWPASLWPASGGRTRTEPPEAASRGASTLRAPPGQRPEAGPAPPGRSFLETLVVLLGASRAALWVYGREEGAWTLEREAAAPGVDGGGAAAVPAEGHPLTWALREGLLLQVTSERLGDLSRAPGWTVLGAVPGSRRALTLEFPGSPPAAARKGVESALAHLADLERAGYLRPS